MSITDTNPTLSEVCEAMAPQDGSDYAAMASPSELTKKDREFLLGRKVGCVKAALKVTRTLARALDGDDEDAPNMAEAAGYLAEVSDWLKNATPEGEAKIQDALERSDLVIRAFSAHSKGPALRPDCYSSKLRKACYHTIMAALATRPSDAAAHLHDVACSAVIGIERAAGKSSGWAHARITAIVQSESL